MKVEVLHGDFSLDERIEFIKKCFINSNIFVLDIKKKKNNFIEFHVNLNSNYTIINMMLKNLTGGGWKEKPMIKRIQISGQHMQCLEKNTQSTLNLLVGFSYANEKTILSVWNPFLYQFHKTNRSCYINAKDIAQTYVDGYKYAIEANKIVDLCDENHLTLLIQNFMKRNSETEYEAY